MLVDWIRLINLMHQKKYSGSVSRTVSSKALSETGVLLKAEVRESENNGLR